MKTNTIRCLCQSILQDLNKFDYECLCRLNKAGESSSIEGDDKGPNPWDLALEFAEKLTLSK